MVAKRQRRPRHVPEIDEHGIPTMDGVDTSGSEDPAAFWGPNWKAELDEAIKGGNRASGRCTTPSMSSLQHFTPMSRKLLVCRRTNSSRDSAAIINYCRPHIDGCSTEPSRSSSLTAAPGGFVKVCARTTSTSFGCESAHTISSTTLSNHQYDTAVARFIGRRWICGLTSPRDSARCPRPRSPARRAVLSRIR